MQSRITIELDFNNGNQPVIQILKKDSDDVRDKILKSFLQKLGGDSSWCRIEWVFQNDDNSQVTIHISPIPPESIAEEGDKMIKLATKLAV